MENSVIPERENEVQRKIQAPTNPQASYEILNNVNRFLRTIPNCIIFDTPLLIKNKYFLKWAFFT